jgi:hypothetical protein
MFTYQYGANPQIDFPRLLISDTQEVGHVFEDSEITMAYAICTSTFQSSMFYSGTAGQTLPTANVSYLRVAALLLESLASNRARLGGITKLLDVGGIDLGKAASELRAQAKSWREVDDESGAFCIIEQCPTTWAFTQRFFAQVQRQAAQ